VSIGRVRGAERIVRGMVIRDPGVGSFFGRNFVTISGGSRVDSYDSGAGAYSLLTSGEDGDVLSNGNISLSGGLTQVHGDATAGGTVSTSGGSTVTGTKTSGATPLTFTPVTPCGPPYYSGAGITGTSWSYNSTTGALSASGGGNITLPNGTFCFWKLTLSGSSTLTVNGPVTMNLTGPSTLSGGGVQNTTHIPANLKIYSSDTNTLVVSGGSGAYMSVYAPDATVQLTGGSHFYGSLIGTSITNSGGTSMHADTALNANVFRLASWREVRRR
jgi:hypothetical protein